MTEAPVTNIQKFSVHDGPGIRSTVFLKGCPLSCIWCANPENISGSRQLTFQESRCIGCGWCRDACPAGAAAAGEGGRTVFDRTRCTLCGRCEQVCPTQACTIQGKIRTAEDLIEELQGDEAFYRRSGGGVTFRAANRCCIRISFLTSADISGKGRSGPRWRPAARYRGSILRKCSR